MLNRNTIGLLPYKTHSNSAKVLSEALGIRRVKRSNSRYRPSGSRILINWGCTAGSIPPHTIGSHFINHPASVGLASHKSRCLLRLREEHVNTVPFTNSVATARQWLEDEPNKPIYCRTQLTASGGEGIVLAHTGDELVAAALYTQFLNARYEYRVHVAFGEVIDARRKSKREGVEGNRFIRNHENGYVFRMTDIQTPSRVASAALAAIEATDLDFGAVDVLYYREQAYILEINTAPGMEGQTIVNYSEAFNRELGEAEEDAAETTDDNF